MFLIIHFADQPQAWGERCRFLHRPTRDNWLGTDDPRRDVLARVLYGLRVSLLFGLALTLVGSIIGIVVGGVQGYYGAGRIWSEQRLMEVWGGHYRCCL